MDLRTSVENWVLRHIKGSDRVQDRRALGIIRSVVTVYRYLAGSSGEIRK